MVWGGRSAYAERLHVPGRGLVEFERPMRSWGIFAPSTAFWERFRGPEREREFLWLRFTLAGTLPPVSGRSYTLVQDRGDAMYARACAIAVAQRAGIQGADFCAHGDLVALLGLVLSAASNRSGDEHEPWRLPAEGPRPTGLLGDIDRLIERSLADPPSRSEIAAELGMSESTFSHRIRVETGTTLAERTRWLRVREAKSRLAERGAAVKEVAAALGFSSASYFATVFRAIAGVSPSEYIGGCKAARRWTLSGPATTGGAPEGTRACCPENSGAWKATPAVRADPLPRRRNRSGT
jgi:AraC-like DNA-binding protein